MVQGAKEQGREDGAADDRPASPDGSSSHAPLQSVMNLLVTQAPIGFAFVGLDMRYVEVNEMLAALHQVPADQHPGRTFEEVIPAAAPHARRVFEKVVREHVPVSGVVLAGGGARGVGPAWEDTWYPVFDDDGTLSGVGVAVIEVTSRRRAQERSAMLQRVNDTLARSETVADAFASLDLIVDEWEGMSYQVWLDSGERLTPVAWGGAELDLIASARPDRSPYRGIGPESGLPVTDVLANGEARYFESRAQLDQRFPAITPILEAADVRSVAYIPLRRSDGVFGVLRWTWTVERIFTRDDRRFFETVGHGLATAYQRAALREREEGERRRAEQILETLAPLASATTTEEVARVVIALGPDPLGANGVSMAIIDPGDPGRRRIVGSVGYPTDFIEKIRVMPIDFPSPVNRVMVSSEPIYVVSRRDMLRDYPEVAADLVGTAKSWAAVPLRSGGRTLGGLTLSFVEHQRFGGAQRMELAGYASHVADALARALRQEEDHEVAVHLQRSLLPANLPRLGSLEVTARYLPGSDLEIGGDWYDAMALDDGRLFLVVGDVMGHGVEAAVAMGQLRAATRALAQSYGPAGLLSELDRFVGDVDHASLATAAAMVINPVSGHVEYSLAGHPPPLVRAPDGTISRLSAALGIPLGFDHDPRPRASTVLPPGSMVVLYTDGLVERRGEDLGTGLGRLEVAVADIDPTSTERAADHLINACLDGYRQRDDIALMCVALSGPPATT